MFDGATWACELFGNPLSYRGGLQKAAWPKLSLWKKLQDIIISSTEQHGFGLLARHFIQDYSLYPWQENMQHYSTYGNKKRGLFLSYQQETPSIQYLS